MNSDSPQNFLPERRSLPHTTPPWVDPTAIFFITVCCASREENRLCHREIADAIFESVRFRQSRGDWFVHLLVLMPDHLHALISFPRDGNMKKTISGWKEITAKKTGVRWQRDFFDHRLRNDENYQCKADYIRMNPVRKGLVATPGEWTFSWEADSL